jgi:hypothetical protein
MPTARTTPRQVKDILDFDPSIRNLDPFIWSANEMVTELCLPVGYSSERLTLIEMWLAAHFVAIRDPMYQSEGIGAANASYLRQGGLNLSQTPYGQQALVLDTKGGLAWIDKHISQGKRAVAGITYLGVNKRAWASYPWRFYTLFQDS